MHECPGIREGKIIVQTMNSSKKREMLNFTVGPVMSGRNVRKIGGQQTPYFRTSEFSEVMFENERLMKEFTKAPEGSRAIFLTASGTGSMETSIINSFTRKDKVLIINGGTFGARFVEICRIHKIPFKEITLDVGKTIKRSDLYQYDQKGFTGLLVNACETSTGVHYDLELISEFCSRNGLFFIIDAISSFLADELDMKKLGADIVITGSQKALACPPGISILVLSGRAIKRAEKINISSLYFNVPLMLKNGERGQTPFTPAVSILLQINERLKEIEHHGGVDTETKRIEALADDFRKKIKNLPFEIVPESMSNALTALHPIRCNAYQIFTTLKNEYEIWICPNGGDLKNKIFRVGHMGDLTFKSNDILIQAFLDMKKRGML